MTIAKVLVGTLSLAFLFYLLLTYTGVKIITTITTYLTIMITT